MSLKAKYLLPDEAARAGGELSSSDVISCLGARKPGWKQVGTNNNNNKEKGVFSWKSLSERDEVVSKTLCSHSLPRAPLRRHLTRARVECEGTSWTRPGLGKEPGSNSRALQAVGQVWELLHSN